MLHVSIPMDQTLIFIFVNTMKKCFFICLLFSFLETSCLVQRSMDLGIETVLESKPPKLSSLLTNIRYVALETTDHSLLKEVQDVVLTDKYIVYSDAEQCYVFDKKPVNISIK